MPAWKTRDVHENNESSVRVKFAHISTENEWSPTRATSGHINHSTIGLSLDHGARDVCVSRLVATLASRGFPHLPWFLQPRSKQQHFDFFPETGALKMSGTEFLNGHSNADEE